MLTKKDSFLQQNFPLKKDVFFNCLSNTIKQIFSFIDPLEYKILYINRVDEGYNIEDVVGKSIFDFIYPVQKGLYLKNIEKVKKTGISITMDVAFLVYKQPDVVNWFKTTISSVYGDNNNLISLMVLSEDITDKKLMEIENNNIRERIKSIINNTTEIIFSIDEKDELLEFNTSYFEKVKRRYGIELQRGMNIFQFLNPEKHDFFKSIFKDVRNGETKNDIETNVSINGVFTYYETSFHPIYNNDNKITGISVFSKDVTNRILDNQKIKNALKEKDILLAEIHHRIKNNLAMVSSFLQLKEFNIKNEEALDALKSSRNRVKTTALIHELLYRNESFQNISLKEFMNELFSLLKFDKKIDLKLQGIDFSFNLSTAFPLGLMLNEIMLNSLKHSFKILQKGTIIVNIQADENNLKIGYYDCEGEFPEDIDFQNNNSTGLTIIHTFIEQLNGSITLVKKNPPMYIIKIPLNGLS